MVAGPLEPGDPREIGPWRLLGRLGSGGQGVVYLAEPSSGDQSSGQVALKRLHAHSSVDPRTRNVFERELAAARRVDPFCTARIIEAGIEDGRPYFVSEYVDGPSLREAVAATGPRSGAALNRLAIGTATALVAIHQAGIIHRDFKPSNVILGPDGPRVIDFGIARVLDVTVSVSSGVIGTPAYLAPEQLAEGPLTTAVDVFAWAATMAYAANATPPFGETSIPAVMGRILYEEPDLGLMEGPLRDLATRAFAKDPAARPTAQELLLSLLKNESAQTRTVAHIQPGAEPDPRPGRHSLRNGLAAAGAASAVLVVLLVFWLARSGNPPVRPAAASSPAAPVSSVSSASPASPAHLTPSAGVSPSGPGSAPAKRAVPGSLEGTEATLAADPGGRLALTGYGDRRLDPRTGRFEVTDDRTADLAARSPDGWLGAKISESSSRDLMIYDWRTGEERRIRLPKPAHGDIAWSPDGRKIVLTATGKAVYENAGFMLVDTATWRPTFVAIPGRTPDRFWWNDTSDGLVANSGGTYHYTLRFYDLSGRMTRELKGPFSGLLDGPVSPSGAYVVTRCTNAEGPEYWYDCVWDARTGARRGHLHVGLYGLLGWYDDTHLVVYDEDDYGVDAAWKPTGDTNVKDFRGRTTHRLVDYTGVIADLPKFEFMPYPA
ncbi:protein kinase [Streptosporangiaceae bacterium NEAU-GS5]|nr:protein kinase [Streptosporangiaceae bacterium NEAU-GS5]